MRPNVLVIMTDQERYPPPYEDDAVREFRRTQLPGRERIRARGIELHRHYAGSTACIPSRATMFTGQYPSFHGVTNTDGLAKSAVDPAMHWLDPSTVPTLGDWFRAAGYRTAYRGKWHVSHADLTVPGTHEGLLANDAQGNVLVDAVELYERADRLDPFGFDGWIGREPHGAGMADTGLVRDPIFAAQVDDLLGELTADRATPWLAVASFVNPHDIAFAGPLWDPLGFPPPDATVPDYPEPPSQADPFTGRPRCQEEFRERWAQALFEIPSDVAYRRAYLWLHKLVDRAIATTLDALARTGAADDTIVVLTSDHGDLLGAHGGMQQKWCNAFDEAIRVPMVVAGPGIDPGAVNVPTSHVDVVPTLLGLVGADADHLREAVRAHHSEVAPFVGRDLSPVLTGAVAADTVDAPVYFMTEDRVLTGLRQTGLITGVPFEPVTGNASVETVVATVAGAGDGAHLWKLNHYYDADPRADQDGDDDVVWELFDLTDDPEERVNRASDAAAFAPVHALLVAERDAKRITPRHVNAPA
jgi:arylsulfatase A-like enzyme